MGGAAAVLAAMTAIARSASRRRRHRPGRRWRRTCPAARAQRPGDVLTIYGGKTVEVLNTDAEGRLVLADALVRGQRGPARRHRRRRDPDRAAVVALGARTAGVMANDDDLREPVRRGRAGGRADVADAAAGGATRQRSTRRSPTSRTSAGGAGRRHAHRRRCSCASSSARARWAHLDIAGPAFTTRDRTATPPRAAPAPPYAPSCSWPRTSPTAPSDPEPRAPRPGPTRRPSPPRPENDIEHPGPWCRVPRTRSRNAPRVPRVEPMATTRSAAGADRGSERPGRTAHGCTAEAGSVLHPMGRVRRRPRGLPRGRPQGRHLLPGPVEPRQGRPLHPRRQLHRVVLLEGLRQGRDHHLGDPADRLPVRRPRTAPSTSPAAARAAPPSPGTPTPPPGSATRTRAASSSRCTARPRPGCSDPVLAWADVVGDPERRRRYQQARGKGGLVRVSWDEATEIAAAAHVHTIKTYGPDRCAGFSPIPAMSIVSHCVGTRFIQLIGGVDDVVLRLVRRPARRQPAGLRRPDRRAGVRRLVGLDLPDDVGLQRPGHQDARTRTG